MSEQSGLEWRRLYADDESPGRETVFVRGIARGDYYLARGAGIDVYRVRFWPPLRVQGGDEQYVLGEERARQMLQGRAQKALERESAG